MITSYHPDLTHEDLNRILSNRGETLAELSASAPVLMVFLRHLGCTFCRETLADLQRVRSDLESQGVIIALVHMSSDLAARTMFARYGLEDVPRFADRHRKLYRAFGLRRGTLGQIFGPVNWKRAFEAGVGSRHGVGKLQGNGFQMPGVFLIDQGTIVAGHAHLQVSDRPDYRKLIPIRA
ncbi:MAG: AhpC/TSA family protein [Kiritimatiellae bacterium]|nr:AhpC/TSA family protein [Kiritimatiellia bacterium]